MEIIDGSAHLQGAFNKQTKRRMCFSSWLRELEAKFQTDRLFAIGRLDKQTTGLLLVTNDGSLSYGVCFPQACVKTYIATVEGVVTPQHINKLKAGVKFEEGLAKASEAVCLEEIA